MNGLLRSSPFAPEYAARVLADVPMSRHTSWHVGGPADFFFAPRDAGDLAAFVRQLPAEIALLWIGLGSNLLVRDGGIRGAVIATHGALSSLERSSATRIRVAAGVPCARIARQCVKWGLGPAEFFAGIPGTLGGALAMNAGAWGGETWRHVVEVDVKSRLRRILGLSSKSTFTVNSSHHQAVGILGDGLVRAAWSPEDGVIEAAEGHGDQFLLGVQWHPERIVQENRAAQGLFQAFVDAAQVWEPRMIRESVAD